MKASRAAWRKWPGFDLRRERSLAYPFTPFRHEETTIRTGDLIDLYDEGRLVSAVVVGEEKGRLKVVTESGRDLRVTTSRVAHHAGRAEAGGGATGEDARRIARDHAEAARARLGGVDLPAMWDVLVEEPRRCSLESLAELALGEAGAAARSAMLRVLYDDRTYFTRKGEEYEPRSRELVTETLKREAAEKARGERREAFLAAAREAIDRTPSSGSISKPNPDHAEHVADLVELALMGEEAGSRREAVALLDEAGAPGGPPAERAFGLLRALGIFGPDENLFIHRFHLRREFPPEVTRAAREVAARSFGKDSESGREDLRGLIAFSVDDDLTTELDDALSVEPDAAGPGTLRLGVHIADPDCFVQVGDPVDREAMGRAATFYFPELKLPMIPAEVAERAASLMAEQDRPALSFLVTLSPLAEVLSYRITPSIVRSRARLTYEQADSLLEDPSAGLPGLDGDLSGGIADALARLREVAGTLEAQRAAAGAVLIRSAEVEIRVDGERTIRIRRIDERGPSRRMVSEAMILANSLAAQFCARRGLPAIYRRQPPPLDPPTGAAPTVSTDGYDPVAVRALRRRMRRGEVSLAPEPHHGLGLSAYTQATSPIRRYQDLVVHRQIKASLAGAPPPYDAEALARIAATTEEAERAAREAERGTDEYWILRHYEERIGETLEGIVVAVEPRRTEVELTDTLYTVNLPCRPDHAPGQRLRLTIEAVRPRARRLVLREEAP